MSPLMNRHTITRSESRNREILAGALRVNMRTRIFRTLSTAVSLLLLVAVPTQAGPIKFVDVINVMGDLQRGGQIQQLELRAGLRNADTQKIGSASASTPSTAPGFKADPLATGTLAAFGSQDVASSLNAGTAVAPQQPQGDVQVFDQDTVDGTICDCGEIPGGGGIAWWPFLALIPLVCLTGVCSHDTPTPTPTPNSTPPVPALFCVNCSPTPPPVPSPFCLGCTPPPAPTPFCVNCATVPEPASLLLFGSGIVALTAGARRRLNKRRANKQAESTTEE